MTRSGTPTIPNSQRKRPIVQITLSSEAAAKLDEMAARLGFTRSGMVEELVRTSRR